MPTVSLEVEIKDNAIIIPIGNRSYRIRGLAKNTNGFDSMKVNILARKGEAFFVDTLDIYAARGSAPASWGALRILRPSPIELPASLLTR